MRVLEKAEQIAGMVKRLAEPGAISVICGGRGKGKTNNLAFLGCWASSLGIDVITNIRYLNHPTKGEAPRNVTMISNMSELLMAGAKALRDGRRVLFLGDEVSMFANPRDAISKKGKAMQEFVIVMRHLNMAAIMTTLSWSVIEKTMRESLDAYIDMDSNRKGKAQRYARVTIFEPSGWSSQNTEYSYIVPMSPHPYAGQNLKTYLVSDIDFRECHEYVASTPKDVPIPDAIEEFVRRELGKRNDAPERRYDDERAKVAYWLYMQKGDDDDDFTLADAARLCKASYVTVQRFAHRRRLQLDKTPTPLPLIEKPIISQTLEPEEKKEEMEALDEAND